MILNVHYGYTNQALKYLMCKIYRTIILPVFCMGVKLGRRHCGRKGS